MLLKVGVRMWAEDFEQILTPLFISKAGLGLQVRMTGVWASDGVQFFLISLQKHNFGLCRSTDAKFFWGFYEFLGTQMLNYALLEADRSDS